MSVQFTRYSAHAAAFSTQLIFAGWNILGFLVLREHAGPLIWVLIRNFGGLLMFTGLNLRQQRTQTVYWLPQPDHAWQAFLFSLVSGVAMPYFFLNGLKLTSATLGAIYDGPLMPVCCSAIALTLGIERLAAGWSAVQQLSSILLSALGAILLVLNTPTDHGTDDLVTEDGETAASKAAFFLGNFFLFLECLCMAALLILQKPLLKHYSETNTLLWVSATGTFFTIGLISFSSNGLMSTLSQLMHLLCNSQIVLATSLYLVLMEATLGYVLLSYANATLDSSSVALWGCSQPVSTCLLAFIILDDSMNMLQVLGSVGVILGLAWNVNVPKHESHLEYESVETESESVQEMTSEAL